MSYRGVIRIHNISLENRTSWWKGIAKIGSKSPASTIERPSKLSLIWSKTIIKVLYAMVSLRNKRWIKHVLASISIMSWNEAYLTNDFWKIATTSKVTRFNSIETLVWTFIETSITRTTSSFKILLKSTIILS